MYVCMYVCMCVAQSLFLMTFYILTLTLSMTRENSSIIISELWLLLLLLHILDLSTIKDSLQQVIFIIIFLLFFMLVGNFLIGAYKT